MADAMIEADKGSAEHGSLLARQRTGTESCYPVRPRLLGRGRLETREQAHRASRRLSTTETGMGVQP